MNQILKFYIFYSVCVMIGFAFYLTYVITKAALYGDFIILLNFNALGEGPLELLMAWCAVPGMLYGIYYLVMVLREE